MDKLSQFISSQFVVKIFLHVLKVFVHFVFDWRGTTKQYWIVDQRNPCRGYQILLGWACKGPGRRKVECIELLDSSTRNIHATCWNHPILKNAQVCRDRGKIVWVGKASLLLRGMLFERVCSRSFSWNHLSPIFCWITRKGASILGKSAKMLKSSRIILMLDARL